jgi:hypothetical protein
MADQDAADVALFQRVSVLNIQTNLTCPQTKRMIEATRTILDGFWRMRNRHECTSSSWMSGDSAPRWL